MSQPFSFIEIQLDYCALTFGVSPCRADLSADTPYKCFNMFNTCADRGRYSKSSLVFRYCQDSAVLPRGMLVFPVITSLEYQSPHVNLAGADPDKKPLGTRGTIRVTMQDFQYHDRFYDKYEAERFSGAAQFSGIGENQGKISTHFAKLLARSPFYAGRPLRLVEGVIDDNGVFTETQRRHFIMDGWDGPGGGDTVTITGKDILKKADDDRAVYPKQTGGKLVEDLAIDATSFQVETVALANEYAASGWVSIGSEVIRFTRSGRTFTLTGRGTRGTVASAHSSGDAVQQVWAMRGMTINAAMSELLQQGADIPASFLDLTGWANEVAMWGGNVTLEADITKPTGVNDLLAEFCNLGYTIWFDDIAQKVMLRANRPAWGAETIKDLTESANLIELSQEDRDADRINLCAVWFDTIDPTKSATSADNYSKGEAVGDTNWSGANGYNDTRIRTIFSRVLDNGNASAARIAAKRIVNRFSLAPKRVVVDVDIKDDMRITDVARLNSPRVVQPNGRAAVDLYQVTGRDVVTLGSSIRLTLQRYYYSQRYAAIAPNATPNYNAASTAQKDKYAFFAARGDGDVWSAANFSDGKPPYVFI